MSVRVADLPLWALSWLVWRLVPGRAATKMAEFSHTEAGSGEDMLAAAEETPRADLRARYFRHALDELRHARLFRERAVALGTTRRRGGAARSRAQAVLDDTGYVAARGIRGADSLFTELGEVEFLAFVWLSEQRGAEQFDVYADLLRHDADSAVMFATIAKDERFHIAYSRAELDHHPDAGAVRRAVRSVRWRRLRQAWLRGARDLGNAMGGLWLGLLYVVLLGPFSLAARRERPVVGFVTPGPRSPAAERAREMA